MTDPRGTGRNVTIVLAVLTLVAVLSAGVWVLAQEAPSPTLRLSGGTIYRLKGIEYGRNYTLLQQRLWQQFLAPVLPPSLQGRELLRGSSPQERLTLWFVPEVGNLPWFQSHRLEAVDEHGCRFSGGYEMGLPPREKLPYRLGSLSQFPRRSNSFRLRFYEGVKPESAGELVVGNPGSRVHSVWQPERLPTARNADGLELRLLSLEAGMTREELLRDPPFAIQPEEDDALASVHIPHTWARAGFLLTQNGRPTRHWRLARLTVSDATGNSAAYPDTEECSFRYRSRIRRGDTQLVTVRPSGDCIRGQRDDQGRSWIAFPGLCVHEPAWKLRAVLTYTGSAEGRSPDLSWTVPGVPVVRPFRQTDAIATRSWPGIHLKLIKVSGRGAWGAEKLADAAASARVFVTAVPGDGLALAVTGTDERGRAVDCAQFGSADMGRYHRWWFDLRVPTGAKRLTLRFRGWRGREVQFLARPRPVGTNTSPSGES